MAVTYFRHNDSRTKIWKPTSLIVSAHGARQFHPPSSEIKTLPTSRPTAWDRQCEDGV
jgi:hypothetical protein